MDIVDFFTEQIRLLIEKENDENKNPIPPDSASPPKDTPSLQTTNPPSSPENSNNVNQQQANQDDTGLEIPNSDTSNAEVSSGEEVSGPDSEKKRISYAYRLQKIFTKLNVLSDLLKPFTNPKVDKIKAILEDSLKLFRDVLIPNFETYHEDMDDIIKKYEQLLVDISNKLAKINKEEE